MTSISQLRISGWPELMQLAEHLDVGDLVTRPYLFRGQENADWTLRPSLHRAATNDGRTELPSAADLIKIENALTDTFCGIAANHLPPATVSATRAMIDWWPLMRHYGVPTRLLDWTASFYVGAYFAASKAPDKDGAIYLVHRRTLAEAMKFTHADAAEMPTSVTAADKEFQRPDAPPVVHVYSRKTALLDRMVVQQGVFLVSRNVRADLEEVLATEIPKVADSSKETLRKISVPAALKQTIRRRLRAMNVTGSSLFPGLDGIGRELDELVRNAGEGPGSAAGRSV